MKKIIFILSFMELSLNIYGVVNNSFEENFRNRDNHLTLREAREKNKILKETFLKKLELREVTMHNYTQGLSLLKQGGIFFKLEKCVLCVADLKYLPLNSLEFPKLRELEIRSLNAIIISRRMLDWINREKFELLLNRIIEERPDLTKGLGDVSLNFKYVLDRIRENPQRAREKIPSSLVTFILRARVAGFDIKIPVSSEWSIRSTEDAVDRDYELLGEFWKKVPNLVKLKIADLEMRRIPEQIRYLRNLSDLEITVESCVNKLPSAIKECSNLKNLIWSFSFGFKPKLEEIATLRSLVNLELFWGWYKSGGVDLPQELKNLRNLERFRLVSNNVLADYSVVENWKNLKELTIFLGGLEKVPSWIGNLTKLRKINFVSNKISRISPNIGDLQNLEVLDLTGNKIETIPEEMGNLKNMRTLKLSGNPLTQKNSYPETMGRLVSLENIDANLDLWSERLSKNGLKLDLSNMGLTYIPITIMCFNKLQELNISNNQVKKLPEILVKCKDLRRLDLHGNESISMENISNDLLALKDLESIILSEEKLKNRLKLQVLNNLDMKSLSDQLVKVLGMDSYGNFIVEYTKDGIDSVRKKRLKLIRDEMIWINQEENSQIINFLYLSKAQHGMSDKDLEKYIKKGKFRKKELESSKTNLKQLIDEMRFAINKRGRIFESN